MLHGACQRHKNSTNWVHKLISSPEQLAYVAGATAAAAYLWPVWLFTRADWSPNLRGGKSKHFSSRKEFGGFAPRHSLKLHLKHRWALPHTRSERTTSSILRSLNFSWVEVFNCSSSDRQTSTDSLFKRWRNLRLYFLNFHFHSLGLDFAAEAKRINLCFDQKNWMRTISD